MHVSYTCSSTAGTIVCYSTIAAANRCSTHTTGEVCAEVSLAVLIGEFAVEITSLSAVVYIAQL